MPLNKDAIPPVDAEFSKGALYVTGFIPAEEVIEKYGKNLSKTARIDRPWLTVDVYTDKSSYDADGNVTKDRSERDVIGKFIIGTYFYKDQFEGGDREYITESLVPSLAHSEDGETVVNTQDYMDTMYSTWATSVGMMRSLKEFAKEWRKTLKDISEEDMQFLQDEMFYTDSDLEDAEDE